MGFAGPIPNSGRAGSKVHDPLLILILLAGIIDLLRVVLPKALPPCFDCLVFKFVAVWYPRLCSVLLSRLSLFLLSLMPMIVSSQDETFFQWQVHSVGLLVAPFVDSSESLLSGCFTQLPAPVHTLPCLNWVSWKPWLVCSWCDEPASAPTP